MPFLLGEKRMATEFARSQSTGLSRMGRDAVRNREAIKNTRKTDQYCRAEKCLAIDIKCFDTGVH